ncbi:MAG: histidine--tRNA ligase, partial [Armatimonadota bacterium]
YREHTQLGAEAVGSADPAIDAEVISLAVRFYRSVGLDDFELRLNSIGCPECRPRYRETLVKFAAQKLDKLCPVCATRFEHNPMRMFDCKVPGCREVLADAPVIAEYLGEECAQHFEQVRGYLNDLGIAHTLDPRLVRGFDYYTRTAFEFVSDRLGAQNAIGGGGRYDNLVEEIGGPPTPAIGFGIGLERVMVALEKMNVALPVATGPIAFVATAGQAAHRTAVKLVADLRNQGISADMDYTGRSLKSQMRLADKLGARFTVILGEDEIASGTAVVRSMATSQQRSVALAELASALSEVQ